MYQDGYVYHIKDEYFEKASDPMLMQNKENGAYRPNFYCMRDENTSLLWMVPLSSKWDKYKAIYERQVKRYGHCITIVLGSFDGKRAAFLLQNMFPITEHYIDHIHTRNGNPIPVSYSLRKEIGTNMKQILHIHSRGKKIVYPDIDRLEQMMLQELTYQKDTL